MPNPGLKERTAAVSLEKRVLFISMSVLTVGCIGYFLLPRGLPVFYIFAHLGALGLLGLIGSGVGVLAKKKGRGYLTALFLSSLFPLALGVVAVALFVLIRGQAYCGGSVSLAVAALVTLFYLFISKKTPPQSEHAN